MAHGVFQQPTQQVQSPKPAVQTTRVSTSKWQNKMLTFNDCFDINLCRINAVKCYQ